MPIFLFVAFTNQYCYFCSFIWITIFGSWWLHIANILFFFLLHQWFASIDTFHNMNFIGRVFLGRRSSAVQADLRIELPSTFIDDWFMYAPYRLSILTLIAYSACASLPAPEVLSSHGTSVGAFLQVIVHVGTYVPCNNARRGTQFHLWWHWVAQVLEYSSTWGGACRLPHFHSWLEHVDYHMSITCGLPHKHNMSITTCGGTCRLPHVEEHVDYHMWWNMSSTTCGGTCRLLHVVEHIDYHMWLNISSTSCVGTCRLPHVVEHVKFHLWFTMSSSTCAWLNISSTTCGGTCRLPDVVQHVEYNMWWNRSSTTCGGTCVLTQVSTPSV